jgi:hypothetical protein
MLIDDLDPHEELQMEEIEKFKSAISPFLATWKTIEIKAIADIDKDLMISMISCLSPEEPGVAETTDPIQGISFIRQALPITELDRLLEEWEKGVINLSDHPLSVSEFTRIRYQEIQNPWDDLVIGWPEFRYYRQFFLGAEGPTDLTKLLGAKDVHAIARVLGFNSFAELTSERVQFKVGDSRMTRVYLHAPILASVVSDAKERALNLTVAFHHALQLNEFSLSFRIQDNKGMRVAGGQIALDGFDKRTHGYLADLTSSIAIPDSATSGEAHLFYRSHSAQEPVASTRFVVPPPASDRNPRWDTAVSLVSNTPKWIRPGIEVEDIMKQWLGLSHPEPKAEEFERAISILLFAANLPFLPIGDSDGVDQVILTSEPTQVAIPVACTTSSDVGKGIGNLLKQRNRVADKLPGFQVKALIFAPVEERDLRVGHIEDCKAADIKLVLKNDIQSIFDQVRGVNWREVGTRFIEDLTRPPTLI